jgi:molybdopterin-guanine dinucleotide biosynthesis protein MobB
MENRPVPIEELIGRIHDVDIVLTEGYKHGRWPKLLVHRQAIGKPPVVSPDDCLVVMTDVPIRTKTTCFHLDDVKMLADFLIKDMETASRLLR